jgi:uncharacterized DUF497 family protein
MDNSFIFQGITFLWDLKKAQTNLQKHGVSFEQACEVFFDPFIRVLDASVEDEARDAVIGVNSNGFEANVFEKNFCLENIFLWCISN